jgi:hypothetical protein
LGAEPEWGAHRLLIFSRFGLATIQP